MSSAQLAPEQRGPRKRKQAQRSGPPDEQIAIEHAIARLRALGAKHLAATEAIADAAILAAEQVQDKRLEMLEAPPPVTADAMMIEFFWTFLLESPLIGAVIGDFFNALCANRITIRHTNWAARKAASLEDLGEAASRAELKALAAEEFNRTRWARNASRRGGEQLMKIPDRYRAARGQIVREMEQLHLLSRRIGKADVLLDGLYDLTEAGYETATDYGVALAKGARAVYSDSPDILAEPSDTAGVALIKQVKTFANAHRLSLAIDMAGIEAHLRAGVLAPEDVVALTAADEAAASKLTIDGLRERASRYFEAHIWAQLLWQRPLKGNHPGNALMLFNRLPLYAPGRMLSYWTHRFFDPSDPAGRTFAGRYRLMNPASGRVIDKSGEAVGRYFLELFKEAEAKRTAHSIQQLFTLGAGESG